MKDQHLIEAAVRLTEALNRVVDDKLPSQLARIVKRHAAVAVGCAFIPIPVLDALATAANIWIMYTRINKELDLPFAENIAKSILAGVLTNIGGAVLAFFIVGAVLKIIPILGTISGGILMAFTAYAVTLTSGIVYMNIVAKLLEKKSRA